MYLERYPQERGKELTMSNFNEKLVEVLSRGFESKGSTETKTVILFKQDQEVLFENSINNYTKSIKAGSILEGYGIYMDENNVVHVYDNLSNYIYDDVEEAKEYIPALLNN